MFDSFLQFVRVGGVVMYPLTGIGILTLTLGLYQVLWLGIWGLASHRYSCAGAPYWAKKALTMAQRKTGLPGLSLLESIEMCLARMEDCLTRKVPTLRFLAQISTLLGFLGTVTGMVRVFNTVSLRGIVTPGDLAGGIYEALFTTVYGLVLAIIGWGFSYLIEALARRHLRHLELLIMNELDETPKEKTDSPSEEKGVNA
ncbi:MAG: MotA/TolQ/ExbB proton channel family protein [Candidatus Ozemobacteraceae bacterium]